MTDAGLSAYLSEHLDDYLSEYLDSEGYMIILWVPAGHLFGCL